jgi:hypothetical protein
MALSLREIPMPLRTTRKSTRPRASDRSMVATRTTTRLASFRTRSASSLLIKMHLLRWINPRHNTPRASSIANGLDVANQTRASGAGRKIFLTCPLIDQAITRFELQSGFLSEWRYFNSQRANMPTKRDALLHLSTFRSNCCRSIRRDAKQAKSNLFDLAAARMAQLRAGPAQIVRSDVL